MLPLVSHGANLFNLCPFPDSPALYVQNLFPIGPAVWPHFPGFWIVDPLKPPKTPPWGIVWRIVLAYVHSQMNPQTCSEFGANRSISLAAFPDLSLWPPKTPRTAPCTIEGRIVFSYVHSQTNPQIWTKSWCQSVEPFDSFPRHLNSWPPKTPKMPPGILRGELYLLFSLCPFPDESADVYQIWCQSVQLFDSFPRLLNLWPPKTPWGIEGRIIFSLCRFPDESADLYQIWWQSVQPFDSFPKHLNLWPPYPPPPPPMPPGVLRGDLYLACVYSQMNLQTSTKVGANRSSRLTASQDFWMFDP